MSVSGIGSDPGNAHFWRRTCRDCGASAVFVFEDENLLVEEVVQGRERAGLRRLPCFEERSGSLPVVLDDGWE